MNEILFVYAKKFPKLSYRQGMHEILGPILFVLFFDQQSFAHAEEVKDLEGLDNFSQQIVASLNDSKFLENDAL